MDCGKHPSVLIVDDNSKNLQVLADMLRNSDIRAATAKDGYKALKFAGKRRPDLILLDIMMPEMDGLETCRKLKQNDATADIPVIFISALTDTDDKVNGFKSGGVDYITKPFQREEVIARVMTHVELKRSREELKIAYDELRKANEGLALAARTDSLTKLSNRRDAVDKIENEKTRTDRSGKPFSLILCDIDDFKAFNDEYGHACGDHILKGVAEKIRSRVRAQDNVARWGGEEFLLLLPETDLTGGKAVAEAIRNDLDENRVEYEHRKFRISLTYGVSVFAAGMSIDECIRRADEAMYKGKNAGKNRIVLHETQ